MGKLIYINRAAKAWHEKNLKKPKNKKKIHVKNSLKGASNE